MILNQATMNAAIEYYLENAVFATVQGQKVTSITGRSDGQFEVTLEGGE